MRYDLVSQGWSIKSSQSSEEWFNNSGNLSLVVHSKVMVFGETDNMMTSCWVRSEVLVSLALVICSTNIHICGAEDQYTWVRLRID